MTFSWPTVVISRFTPWRTRLRSVRNSKDLIIRTVMVAEVFGRATFVRASDSLSDIFCLCGMYISLLGLP